MIAISVFLALVAAVLCVMAAKKLYKNSGSLLEMSISDRLYWTIFVFFALVAVFVRVYKFGQIPGGFFQDGAMAAVDGKALADHGTDRYGMSLPVHLTAWGYGQMSALLSYMMVPFIKLLGFSSLSARMPLLIISLLGLGALYLFSRDAFGKKAALLIFAFGCIAPWHFMQSRWALDCNLYPHFFLFGIYFLNRTLKAKRRKLNLSVSMVMFGLCMYCYGIAIYTMPVFLVTACIYLLVKKEVSIPEALLALVVWLVVSWPFILVMAINFFKWDTIEIGPFTLPYFPDSRRSSDILFFHDPKYSFLTQLLYDIKCLLLVVFVQAPDKPWNSMPAYGTIYLFSMPLVLLGLGWTLLQFRKNTAAALLILFYITGLWCGICTIGVNVNRINIIFYPQIIFAALGIYLTVRSFSSVPLRAGLAAVYMVSFALMCVCYFGENSKSLEYYFYKDFGDAMQSIKDDDAEKLYITATMHDDERENLSEILTLFYHETDAEYYQGKTCPEGLLPFNERYTFAPMEDIEIDPEEDAVYVAAAEELDCFDLTLFDARQYGDFYVLERKD